MVAHIARRSDTGLLLSQVQLVLSNVCCMCLPSLETLGLYSFSDYILDEATFKLGSSSGHATGVWTVCRKVGSLVAGGALPSLKQVRLTKNTP